MAAPQIEFKQFGYILGYIALQQKAAEQPRTVITKTFGAAAKKMLYRKSLGSTAIEPAIFNRKSEPGKIWTNNVSN